MRIRGSRDSSVIEGIAADRAITPNIMAVRKLSFPMFVYTAMAVHVMTRAMGPRKVPLETIPKLSSVIATTARQGMSPASKAAIGVTRNNRKRQTSNIEDRKSVV